MKKKFFFGVAFMAVAACAFGLGMANQASDSALTPLQMQNLNALTQSETDCTNPNGYRRILEGNEKIYDCCYVQQIGEGRDDCKRW